MRKVNASPTQLRDTIGLLNRQGEDDAAIAKRTGLTLIEVIAEREALGLEIATTVAITWTSAEDAEILRLRDVKNLRWTEIATRIGTGKLSKQVQARYKVLDIARTRRSKNGTPKHRDCKGCGRKFYSQGHHNRYCDPCRNGESRSIDSNVVTYGNVDWSRFE